VLGVVLLLGAATMPSIAVSSSLATAEHLLCGLRLLLLLLLTALGDVLGSCCAAFGKMFSCTAELIAARPARVAAAADACCMRHLSDKLCCCLQHQEYFIDTYSDCRVILFQVRVCRR
jgi:hypothetical protein